MSGPYRDQRNASDKVENVRDKTKDFAHNLVDKTKEVFTGETPVERHERKIEKEQEKFSEKAFRHIDDPQKINTERAKRDYNIAKEEERLNRDLNRNVK